MQKLTFFFVVTITATLLYFGISSYRSSPSASQSTDAAAALNYDAYSEGINTVLFDIDGSISYTLQADRQYHYRDESSDLENPFLRLYKAGDSQWNIIADSGHIAPANAGDDSRIAAIELKGDVEVYSQDEFGNRTVLTTEYLSIDPNAETMQTDRLVTMVSTNVRQSGIGMFADLNSDELSIQSNNEGIYEQALEL